MIHKLKISIFKLQIQYKFPNNKICVVYKELSYIHGKKLHFLLLIHNKWTGQK